MSINSLPFDDDVHLMSVVTLVDSIDDRIDSSCKINLCPTSVESIVLDDSTSSCGNYVDQISVKLVHHLRMCII